MTINQGTLSLRALATLTVKNTLRELVIVGAIARDSQVPGVLDVNADPKTVTIARHQRWVQLDLLGTSFRTRVLGRLDEAPVLLVAAEPLFRALANQLKSLGSN